MSLSTRILEKLAERGMKQKNLAESVSLSATQISNIIKHDQIPNAIALGEIAKALNCTTDYLLFGETEKANPMNDALLNHFNKLQEKYQIKAIGEVAKLLAIQEVETNIKES